MKTKRLPNKVDWFMGELMARVQMHPDDENVLAIVRKALADLDELAATQKKESSHAE